MDRKLTSEQAKESFPGVEPVTSEDISGILQDVKIAEIVSKIGKYNISVEGEGLSISDPNAWVKKNVDLIRANKTGIVVYMNELKKVWAEEAAARSAAGAAEKAADKPLLDAMEQKATELRASIPVDHTEVTVKQTGDMDGDPILEYTANGVKLNWRDVEVIGVASAIRPGAMGAFATERVCSISQTKLEEIRAAQQATENKKAEVENTEIDRVTSIFATAQATGTRQELRHYMADCNDQHEECNTDIVTIWAMPDGSEKTTKVHTW